MSNRNVVNAFLVAVAFAADATAGEDPPMASGGHWRETRPLPEALAWEVVVPVGHGRVFITGGLKMPDGSPNYASYLFEPGSGSDVDGTWNPVDSPNDPQCNHGQPCISKTFFLGVTLGNGKVLVFTPDAEAALFDPDAPRGHQWAPTGSLPPPTEANPDGTYLGGGIGVLPVLLKNGDVLAAGGYGTDVFHSSDSSVIYHVSTGKWVATGPMVRSTSHYTPVLLDDGRVLAVGGGGTGHGTAGGTFLSSFKNGDPTNTQIFTPDGSGGGSWSASVAQMPGIPGEETATTSGGRQWTIAVRLPGNRVFVNGGENIPEEFNADIQRKSTLIYDADSDTWTAPGALPDLDVFAGYSESVTYFEQAPGEILVLASYDNVDGWLPGFSNGDPDCFLFRDSTLAYQRLARFPSIRYTTSDAYRRQTAMYMFGAHGVRVAEGQFMVVPIDWKGTGSRTFVYVSGELPPRGE